MRAPRTGPAAISAGVAPAATVGAVHAESITATEPATAIAAAATSQATIPRLSHRTPAERTGHEQDRCGAVARTPC